jgi:threonine/homoserine/homoserine lactone efflux protein
MPNSTVLLAFVAASLVVLIIPGPGVVYVLARSLSQGVRAGLISVLGLAAGVFVHIAAAAAGISAVLLASATAFNAVKALGAGYLIYLGLRTIFARASSVAVIEIHAQRSSQRLFVQGVLVSVFNPKIALFFLAFLPQFVAPGRWPVPQQVLFLGFVYVGLALITDGTYAMLAAQLQRRLSSRIMKGPLPRYVSGSVFVGLGLSTALTGSRK